MSENRVVEGRMVNAHHLAELIEGEDVLETEPIEDAERECPDCGGDVLRVQYMPTITELVTGSKCQDCSWSARE